jgi:predicted glycoside hydrolase/deacetylase ChbG (UPF0249 family)
MPYILTNCQELVKVSKEWILSTAFSSIENSMTSSRFLIINADDLGLSPEVNRGIFTAYEHGVVTDSSLLIKGSCSQEAITMLRKNPQFPIGIHIDLDPLLGWGSPGKEKFTRQELNQLMNDPPVVKKIQREINEQIEAFFDTGLIPSHIDTHHHIHGFPRIFEPLIEAMDKYGIKAIRFNKTGYALMGRADILVTAETAQWMEETLCKKGILHPHLLIDPLFPFSLKEIPQGITELMVHPSSGGDVWRQKDLTMLTDPYFIQTVGEEGIGLISFSALESSLSR